MPELGRYYGKPTGGVTTEASTGSAQIVVILELSHIARNSQWEPLGASLQDQRLYLSLHENSYPYTEKKLRLLGFNGNFEAPAFSVEGGLEFDLVSRTYNNRTTDRWEMVGGGELTPAPAETQRALTTRWRATNAAVPAPSGAPASPPAASPMDPLPQVDADGIPF